MNTTAALNIAPLQLLSNTARAAAALMVLVFLATAWASASNASHQAVVTTIGALTATHVTLPSVEVVSHRDGAKTASASRTAPSAL